MTGLRGHKLICADTGFGEYFLVLLDVIFKTTSYITSSIDLGGHPTFSRMNFNISIYSWVLEQDRSSWLY